MLSTIPSSEICRVVTQVLQNKLTWRQGVKCIAPARGPSHLFLALESPSPPGPDNSIHPTADPYGVGDVQVTERRSRAPSLSGDSSFTPLTTELSGPIKGKIMKFMNQWECTSMPRLCRCSWSGKMQHFQWKASKAVGKARENIPV